MLMGQKYRVRRSVIIEQVKQLSGVDIMVQAAEPDVQRAVDALVRIKECGLSASDARPAV